MEQSFENSIKFTPIYLELSSQGQLDAYLKTRQIEFQSKPRTDEVEVPTPSEPVIEQIDSTSEPNKTEEEEDEEEEEEEEEEIVVDEGSAVVETLSERKSSVEIDTDENEMTLSDDDFSDLPSNFDNDELLLDEFVDNNGDMEFLRNAAKNLMSSLSEMEAASASMNTLDAPHSLLYGDDFMVTIKNRRFALAFLDYTQFRVEKQRNPDKYRLLASLKKTTNQKKRLELKQRDEALSPTFEPDLSNTNENKSTNKKKRNKRNRKKKSVQQDGTAIQTDKPEATPESIEDDDDENTMHVLNDHDFDQNHINVQRLPHVYLDNEFKPCIVVAGEDHNEENEQDTGEHDDWHNIVAGGKPVLVPKKTKKKKQQQQQPTKAEQTQTSNSTVPILSQPSTPITDSNSLIIPLDCRGFIRNPKLCETFRLRLRRSFSSINIRFNPSTYVINIDGNNKINVQQCLNYLQTLSNNKRTISIDYNSFPQTTVTNIIRMQQSTAQIKLDLNAKYDRIFRSTARLLDYQIKQQFNQQQCLYCRQSNKQFRVTYLDFPAEKQTTQELNENIRQRILQLLTTRFTYIAIALSTDLLTTKRWKDFYANLVKHKDANKTLLIRKINNIIQVYGLHAHVQQIQILITRFLDANRYETDVVESEQV